MTNQPPPKYVPLDQIDLRLLHPEAAYRLPVMVRCPFHLDDTASMGVYPRNTYCFSCNAHESAFDYIRRFESERLEVEPDEIAHADIMRVLERLRERGATVPKAAPAEQETLDSGIAWEYERVLDEYHNRRTWLTTKYGLTIATQKAAHVGHAGTAYSLPVFGLDGLLLTVRFRRDEQMLPNGRVKYWGVPGHNGAMWYLPPSVRGASLREAVLAEYGKPDLVVTEGEFAALALWQLAIPAVSATNGKDVLARPNSPLLADLQGLKVWLCYDQDEAGRAAAERVLQNLQQLGIEVANVTWDLAKGKDPADLVARGLKRDGFRRILGESLKRAKAA